MEKRTLLHLILFLLISCSSSLLAQVQIGPDLYGNLIGDFFGSSVALSADGSRIAIGATQSDYPATEAGYVQIYERIDGAWIPLGDDIEGEVIGDLFGHEVALSADGQRVAISAIFHDAAGFEKAGLVQVYEWNGEVWNQIGADLEGSEEEGVFGYSIAFSADGSRLAIGETGVLEDGGRVQIFDWNAPNWIQVGNDIVGSDEGNLSGWSVDLSAEGNRVAIGSYFYPGNGEGSYTGAVHLYELNTDTWNPLGEPIIGEDDDFLGASLSLSSDGTRLAIGAKEKNTEPGYVIIHHWLNGSWVPVGERINGDPNNTQFGSRVRLSGDGQRLAVGTPGQVRLYNWHVSGWTSLGNTITEGTTTDYLGYSIDLAADGNYLATSAILNDESLENSGQVSVYYFGDEYLSGYVRADVEENCMAEETELGVPGVPITFDNGEMTAYSFTNAQGRYSVVLDPGEYEVSLDLGPPLNTLYYSDCPESQTVTITETPDSQVFDLALNELAQCPNLVIDISTDAIRICEEGVYVVTYCNQGTQAAEDVYIEIELGHYLSYAGSSIPHSSQVGNLLQFQVGTLDVFDCNFFTINFWEDCEAEFGQVHCTTAHIYPDTVCNPEAPNILVQPNCEDFTLSFDVTNLADPFPSPLPYLIMHEEDVIDYGEMTLNTDETINLPLPDDNDFPWEGFQLIIAPGETPYYTATPIWACDPTSFSQFVPFAPHTPQGYSDADCQSSVGSYDPNDKRAFPQGIGEEHAIPPNTPLEYMIRFQNTGTDYARFVHVLDTLSPLLDPASLRVLAASHAYTVNFLPPTANGQQVLDFLFDDIYLPDSLSNPIGSQGFVKFSIRMKENLPLGTVIENKAAIYFDYNEPVLTNMAFHTLALPDITVSTEKALSPDESIAVYPNPTTSKVFLDPKLDFQRAEINIKNTLGQLISASHYSAEQVIEVDLIGEPGIYFLEVILDQKTKRLIKVVKQ